MYSCWRGSCRRLTTRALWIICCTACLSSLVCVFLIINYLEDHRECNRNNLEPKTGSYSTSLDFHGQDPRNDLNDIFRENRELKRFLKRLTQPSSLGKVGSILPGVFHLPQGNIASWQERSLKYIPGDVLSPRLELSAMSRDETLNCKSIARIHIVKEIGRGYTKVTQLGVYNGLEVAVKSSGLDSTDVQRCIEEKRSKNPEDCLVFSRYKIMKELLLYQQLHHPNIVKLLGYCLQNDKDTGDISSRGLTVVTELGSPVDLMAVLQMPWHQRFRIAVGLARLVNFFSNSPLGSLVIRDFQLIQFVVVDGEIKLSDLDDVGNEPQLCHSPKDCLIGNEKYNITLECSRGECQGYNEKLNIYNLHRFYLNLFLLPGAPHHVGPDLEKVEDQAALLNSNSKSLVEGLEAVLTKLRTGKGLKIATDGDTQYRAVLRADFPGLHDYQCPHSLSVVNCQLLAFNEEEAKQRCNEDHRCQAFVMSYEKTWTGYRTVYLKNSTSKLVFSALNMVYIKVA